MANLNSTPVNLSSVILKDGEFRDEILDFTNAGTVLAGTILARDSSSSKLVPFVKGSTDDDLGIPKSVLTYDVVASIAGGVSIRDMISGSVRAERLIINADGNGSRIDASVLDQLRVYSLISIDVQELNILDNQ